MTDVWLLPSARWLQTRWWRPMRRDELISCNRPCRSDGLVQPHSWWEAHLDVVFCHKLCTSSDSFLWGRPKVSCTPRLHTVRRLASNEIFCVAKNVFSTSPVEGLSSGAVATQGSVDGWPLRGCLTGNRCVSSEDEGLADKCYWRTSAACHNTGASRTAPPSISRTGECRGGWGGGGDAIFC